MKASDLRRAMSDLKDEYILEAAPVEKAEDILRSTGIPETGGIQVFEETAETPDTGRPEGIQTSEKADKAKIIPFYRKTGFRAFTGFAAACLLFVVGMGIYQSGHALRKSESAISVQEKADHRAEDAPVDEPDAMAADEAQEMADGPAADEAQEMADGPAAGEAEDMAEDRNEEIIAGDTAEGLAARTAEEVEGMDGNKASEDAGRQPAEVPEETAGTALNYSIAPDAAGEAAIHMDTGADFEDYDGIADEAGEAIEVGEAMEAMEAGDAMGAENAMEAGDAMEAGGDREGMKVEEPGEAPGNREENDAGQAGEALGMRKEIEAGQAGETMEEEKSMEDGTVLETAGNPADGLMETFRNTADAVRRAAGFIAVHTAAEDLTEAMSDDNREKS